MENYLCEAVLPSDTSRMAKFNQAIIALLEAAKFNPKTIFGIRLATEEAFVNAIKHGNGGDHDKHVMVSCRISENVFTIRIKDEGEGFEPGEVPDPTAPENLAKPSGRGLMLMRNYLKVEFNETGNCVTMELAKRL